MFIRDWYTSKYPTDELGEEINGGITFLDVIQTMILKADVYDTLGVEDSLVRERVFMELSERLEVSVEDVYELWIR